MARNAVSLLPRTTCCTHTVCFLLRVELCLWSKAHGSASRAQLACVCLRTKKHCKLQPLGTNQSSLWAFSKSFPGDLFAASGEHFFTLSCRGTTITVSLVCQWELAMLSVDRLEVFLFASNAEPTVYVVFTCWYVAIWWTAGTKYILCTLNLFLLLLGVGDGLKRKG